MLPSAPAAAKKRKREAAPAAPPPRRAAAPARAAPPPAQQQKLLDDLEGERRLQARLAKKLRGRLAGPDDGMGDLLDNLPGDAPGEEEESGFDANAVRDATEAVKQRRRERREAAAAAEAAAGGAPPPTPARYLPPAARASAAAMSDAGGADAAEGPLRRAVRGLLNRLGAANCARVATQLGDLPASQTGFTRRGVVRAVGLEVCAALEHGPRASPGYAAALAALLTGLVPTLGPVVGAEAMALCCAALARCVAADDARGADNAASFFARAHLVGLAPPPILWGLLDRLGAGAGGGELEAATMLSVLRGCGHKLRREDPHGLKAFIDRVSFSASAEAASPSGLSTRARLLLDLVVDIKNGKRGGGGAPSEPDVPPLLAAWLKDTGAADEAARELGGLTWDTLVARGDGSSAPASAPGGAWWVPHHPDAAPGGVGGGGGGGGVSASVDEQQRALVAAAKAQRMHTPARVGAFVALMGASDAPSAAERLLRLGLPGSSERELAAVLLHCCLVEPAYNPFYAAVAQRLAAAARRHVISLQYCVWDAWKGLEGAGSGADARDRRAGDDSTHSAQRISHLARFVGACVTGGVLPASVLKGANWAGAAQPGAGDAHARLVAHLRLLLRALICPPRSPAAVHAVMAKLAGRPPLALLRAGLLAFMRRKLLPQAEGTPEEGAVCAAIDAAEAGLRGESLPQAKPV